MEIIFTKHAIDRAKERGTDINEIKLVLKEGIEKDAKNNKFQKEKIFTFEQKRGNVFYKQKKVRVIYRYENKNIIIITVYVFYGVWEEKL